MFSEDSAARRLCATRMVLRDSVALRAAQTNGPCTNVGKRPSRGSSASPLCVAPDTTTTAAGGYVLCFAPIALPPNEKQAKSEERRAKSEERRDHVLRQ
jgi:hypothetical protein